MQYMDWISLFVRWFHVIAGVAWIGASFYFIWLDNNLREPPQWKKDQGIKGDLWAIHGGGFYEIGKYAYGPEKMPETLHWFKWEAYTTWLSGFALLVLVYYFGASAYLIDPSVMALTESQAVLLGLGLVFGGLAIYELACRSKLGDYPLAFAGFLVIFICLASYLASAWFSGRGAFIHVGALVGTIMAGNVFFKIMPAQRLMVDAVANKKEVDPSWGAGAKLRSVHNNYLTLPLLFIMISNHYPVTYQHEHNWLVLVLIMAISAWIRHFFNLKHIGIIKPQILVSGAAAMFALVVWVSWPQTSDEPQSVSPRATVTEDHKHSATMPNEVSSANALMDAKSLELSNVEQAVSQLIVKHCVGCHSKTPTDDTFKIAPLGVVLDSWQDIQRQAPQIYRRTSVTKDMPFLNKTKMTDAERLVIKQWFEQK